MIELFSNLEEHRLESQNKVKRKFSFVSLYDYENDLSTNPQNAIEDLEEEKLLRKAISLLPSNLKTCFLAVNGLCEMRSRDLAQKLGLSHQTICNYAQKARKILQIRLKGYLL